MNNFNIKQCHSPTAKATCLGIEQATDSSFSRSWGRINLPTMIYLNPISSTEKSLQTILNKLIKLCTTGKPTKNQRMLFQESTKISSIPINKPYKNYSIPHLNSQTSEKQTLNLKPIGKDPMLSGSASLSKITPMENLLSIFIIDLVWKTQ